MDINDIQKKLNSVNWSFDFTINYGSRMLCPFNCRKYYSYPATFIPEIPYTLIEILSKKGDVVLDPFGGIGTTFIQALSLERKPYSFDINPIPTSVCETLYQLLDPDFEHERVRLQLLEICDNYDVGTNYTNNLSPFRKELTDWYERETFNELSYLLCAFDQIADDALHIVLELILQSILVTLSSQNKGWAYIADNVKPKKEELRRKNVFEHYKNTVKALFADIMSHLGNLSDNYDFLYKSISVEPRVFQESIINSSLRDESVDLVITSPPYPRMIDYVKSQRLSFYFAEKDFHDYVAEEIGARCRRTRLDALTKYKQSIDDINRKIFKLLKKDSFLCLILPDYEDSDNRKETIDAIVKWYSEFGFKKTFEIGRYIPSNKRTLSIQWASLVNEKVYIFQKG